MAKIGTKLNYIKSLTPINALKDTKYITLRQEELVRYVKLKLQKKNNLFMEVRDALLKNRIENLLKQKTVLKYKTLLELTRKLFLI